MSTKKDILKNKKAIIGIAIGIVVFILVGSIGKTQNEEKAIIKDVQAYLNNGEITYAEDLLRNVIDDTKNKQLKKLWSISYGYEQASNALYLNDDIEATKEILDKIDKSYKDYEPVKSKIDTLIADMKSMESIREETDKIIEKVEKLLKASKAEEALEIVYNLAEKEGRTQKQKDKLWDLRRQSEEMKWANADLEKEEKRKKEDEEFTVDKAIEYAEGYSLKNGLDTLEVKVNEIADFDEDNKKFYNVDVYLKDDEEILENYRVYSNGVIKRLD